MPFEPNGFLRFLQPLNRRSVDRAVERHQGNHGVGQSKQAWTCQRHLKALLFAQLTDLNSLREIEQGLDDKRAWLYHPDLRAAPRTTLSDASARRPAAVFRDICLDLMGQVSRQLRREGDAIVRLLDSTPIQLRSSGFEWAQSDPHTTGLKLHFVYDPRGNQPVWLDITSPRVNDVTVARQWPIQAGSTSVFDKAYTDYDWWHRLAIPESAIGLASALRDSLLQVHAVKRTQEGKNEKMELLYQYFSGPEFRQRVELVVGSFAQMKDELEKEKRAMTKIWAMREKQIENVLGSITSMNGHLQALMGDALPETPLLSLDQIAGP